MRIWLLQLMLFVTAAAGVTLQRAYPWAGDDYIIGIAAVPDGGLFAVACAESTPGFSGFRLLRLTGNGDTLWTRIVAIPGSSFQAQAFIPSEPGGGLVVGRLRRERSDWDNCAVAIDSNGALLWWNSWGSTAGEGLTAGVRSVSGWVVCGYTLENGDYDFRLHWLGDSGSVVRSVMIVESGPQYPSGIVGGKSGTFLLVVNQLPGGIRSSWVTLMKFDSSGSVLWQRRYGDVLWNEARALVLLPGGGVGVLGFSASTEYGMQALATAVDSSGQVGWLRQYGGSGSERLLGGAVTGDGSLVGCGETQPLGIADGGIYLVRIRSDGVLAWERRIFEPAGCFGTAILPLGDTGLVIAGGLGVAGNRDAFVVWTDSLGRVGLSDVPAESPVLARPSGLVVNEVFLPSGGRWCVYGAGGAVAGVWRGGDIVNVARLAVGVYVARCEDGRSMRLVRIR